MKKLREILFGKPRNALSPSTRRHIALIAFLAWVGLGADGLSSANYGPEQAFITLGKDHHYMAFYLAIAMTLTIFLISAAYNQVVRLFPNGGGGYKVASVLLGPIAGLISGAALVIDYTLTIATSVASGTDALFSLLPDGWQTYKLSIEVLALLILLYLNLRGAKESIRILLPIFLGFFITHILIILYGVFLHKYDLPVVAHQVVNETKLSIQTLGLFPVLALFMRAYSVGAGTYTGLEAVSNNVHILKEPRVKTARWTMFYMAVSLSLIAGGVILLYLLWGPHPSDEETLNAVVFNQILSHWPPYYHHLTLIILLLFETGILYVAANTGFLGGPAVLANMAVDSWVPKRFAMLSSRLVTQNGIVFFGLLALFILLATRGNVSFLVILYSMNVFLTFSMSLLGLTSYWWKRHKKRKHWVGQITLSIIALLVCIGILISMLLTKFQSGGWITVVFTSIAISIGLVIRRHYRSFAALKKKLNEDLHIPLSTDITKTKYPALDPKKKTAVFLVSEIGAAMHAILWVQRMFPHYFHNFVYISHGEIDIGSFGSKKLLRELKAQTENTLDYLVKFAHQYGIAAEYFCSYGTDPVDHIQTLAQKVNDKYTDTIYFASRYVYPTENWLVRLLHSNMTTIIQRRLQTFGVKMLVLPLQLKT